MSFGHLNHGKPPLEVTVVTGASSDIVEFTAGGAIVAGDVVAFDVAGQTGEAQTQVVIQASTANAAAIGVAVEAITAAEATAGAQVRVCIAGYIQGVNAAGGAGLAQGNPVVMSGATAGCVDISAAGSITPVLGVALDPETVANTVTLYLFRQL
tara:strand:+ start:2203 stop:2664 length:462 start_codon:yes stop_codon:yes gene_type:complete